MKEILKEANNPEMIEKIIQALYNNKISYCIFGGVAVAYYTNNSRKMSPEDIDIMIKSNSKDSLKKIMSDLDIDLIKTHFFENREWLLFEQGSQQIDIALVGKSEEHFINNAESSGKYFYASKFDLCVEKMKSNRKKDQYDLIIMLYNDKSLLKKLISYAKSNLPENRREDFETLATDIQDFELDILKQLYRP